MILLTLLITVLLEHYFDLGKHCRRWGWFESYAVFIEKQLHRYFHDVNEIAVLLAILFPVVLLVGLCQSLLNTPLWGFLDLVFGVAVLLMTIEARSLIKAYMGSSTSKSEAAEADLDSPGHLTFAQFCRAEKEKVFAPVFWYVLFGPMGAVLYRLSLICARMTNNEQRQSLLTQLIGWLEWIPVRLAVLSFAIVDNFLPCFKYWLTSMTFGPQANDDVLIDGANRASNIKPQTPVHDNPETIGLFAHSLILWLVLVAILTVTAWVN